MQPSIDIPEGLGQPAASHDASTLEPWSILYRGPLSSCNYACDYCPFAKTRNTRRELEDDKRKLDRFIDWVQAQAPRSIGVLMTPWGEALIRRSYQSGLARLSHMAHVRRAAIQTNLSCPLGWTEQADLDKLALWTTFHPTQTTLERFVARCRELDSRGVRYSVGVVGFKEAFAQIEQLRDALSPDVYLWVNAYKRQPGYYSEEDLARVERVDPLFRYNTRHHVSRGKACRAGHTTFSVDGDGVARRCHFLKTPIGHIDEPGFAQRLKPSPCEADTCGCYIGYVHLHQLDLYEVFGPGVLERIPEAHAWRQGAEQARAAARARVELASSPA